MTAVASEGVPATVAALIQRLFTAWLPPVWGFLTLTWMRRREYV